MDFYFVYSSGGGAGDWNAIDRIWKNTMPTYFRNKLLIKFGDVFFNHRSSNNLIKSTYWNGTQNVRDWLVKNTKDVSLNNTRDLLLDVGTSKIVSYITHHYENATGKEIIKIFDELLISHSILDKYCKVILDSDIENAVTFDIPNLFKVRTQAGNVSRNLFNEPGCRDMLIDASANYANYTYQNINKDESRLMTIICAQWSDDDIKRYLKLLDYKPVKIAIGGLTDYSIDEFSEMLSRIDRLLDLNQFERVHFLGSGGLKKTNVIISTLGNKKNFSVDNTTPYNRAIDGNKAGTSQSGYYDYKSKSLYRINPDSFNQIMELHKQSISCAHFSIREMEEILNSILTHQTGKSSHQTFDNRAKLIIHNFDVYRHNAD